MTINVIESLMRRYIWDFDKKYRYFRLFFGEKLGQEGPSVPIRVCKKYLSHKTAKNEFFLLVSTYFEENVLCISRCV